MEELLKPQKCPKCNKKVEVEDLPSIDGTYFVSHGIKCIFGPTMPTQKEAIETWNRISYDRPPQKKQGQ